MGAQPEGVAWPADGALPPALVESAAARPWSAYVHVPFCTVRCGYCDFNTYTVGFGPGADRTSYTDSVLQEIDQSARIMAASGMPARPLRTIFFGGGTPSLLDPTAIGAVIERLRDTWGLAPGAEITLETNPETATPAAMRGFAAAGVNRVSIGMQSAVPRVLQVLDRQHRQGAVGQTVALAQEEGLRTSIDLIYGAPSETLPEWQRSLEAALELAPDHISAYSLIVEPGTKMAAQIARGELPGTDDDLDADKYLLADQLLGQAGYHWYEISNFAKSAADASLHNLAYWNDWDWWGYGPGAHSHVGRLRWWNVKHPRAYADRTAAGRSPAHAGEQLDAADRHAEQVMLQIRTSGGVAADVAPAGVADELVAAGLVERTAADAQPGLVERTAQDVQPDSAAETGPRLVLTLRGRLLADQVTRQLLGW